MGESGPEGAPHGEESDASGRACMTPPAAPSVASAGVRSGDARALRALGAPSEASLQAAWERGPLPAALCCEEGERLRPLHRGRRGGGPGPDFQDAILLRADGRLLRGAVELHVRAGDWWRHGHHRDPAYGAVVLHVVAAP